MDDFVRCEKFLTKSLKHPYVQHLIESLQKGGVALDPKTFFNCEPCVQPSLGNLVIDDKGGKRIVLCSNHIPAREVMEETMVHELIHVYDDVRAHVDWNNPNHRACSEIRAANLSGDCMYSRELGRFMSKQQGLAKFFARINSPIFKQQPVCVKRRTKLALSAVGIPDSVSVLPLYSVTIIYQEEAISKVWDSWYNDISPFHKTV